MESDNATDVLLNAIRAELNSIINDRETESKAAATAAPPNDAKPPKKKVTIVDPRSAGDSAESGRMAGNIKNVPPELAAKLSDIDTKTHPGFLMDEMSKSIDTSIKKMQIDLKESYELFQNVGEKFENINFNSLKNRIKDLHLSNPDAVGKTKATDLKNLFEQSYLSNNLDKLTAAAGEQFRSHPGEFGDIPEVSAFFTACSQLQHGLETLKKQRDEAFDLEKRMTWATEASFDRVEEIRKQLAEKNQTAFENNK